MILYQAAKWLHILGGFTALLVCWIPMVVKKGGKVHVRFGWVYVMAMGIVALTALVMGGWRIGWDPDRDVQSVAFAWFLIFISVLSSACAWYGIRVLPRKKRSSPGRHPVDLGFPLMLLLSGLAMAAYGWHLHFPLLTWFPLIGVFLGSAQLSYWLRKPKDRMHWWYEHIIGMLACCIATITAFTVFGAPRLLGIASNSPLLWFTPTLIFTPIITAYTVYYRRKFLAYKNKQDAPHP